MSHTIFFIGVILVVVGVIITVFCDINNCNIGFKIAMTVMIIGALLMFVIESVTFVEFIKFCERML